MAAAAQAFIEAGVPHVVAVRLNTRVSDMAAHTFTRAFYLALAVGDTLQAAYDIGVQAVVSAPGVPGGGELEANKFLLLPSGESRACHAAVTRLLRGDECRLHGCYASVTHRLRGGYIRQGEPRRLAGYASVTRRLLVGYASVTWLLHPAGESHAVSPFKSLAAVEQWEPPAPPAARQQQPLPALVEGFLGRNVEAYRVVSGILDRRLVSVTGEVGVGKSAVAIAALNYLAERHYFSDGVLYIDASHVRTIGELARLLHSRTALYANAAPSAMPVPLGAARQATELQVAAEPHPPAPRPRYMTVA